MKTMPWPSQISFVMHQESESIQHFPLPVFKSYFKDMSEVELMARLRHETGCETAMEFFLPVEVIWSAWMDASFRALLLRDANAALAAKGYTATRKIIVHENESALYHLSLKAAPAGIGRLSVIEARSRYISIMERAASSQCCASGTCDDIPSRG